MTTRTAPVAGIPAAPPLPAELDLLLRRLRLPHIRRHAPEVIATAKAQRWEPAEVLKVLFAEEAAGRDRSALATRRAAAGFPTGKTFHAWQPELSSIPAPTQQALRTLEWIGRRENLVVCGPSGTGKTFLLEALGQQAVEHGLHVAGLQLRGCAFWLPVLLRVLHKALRILAAAQHADQPPHGVVVNGRLLARPPDEAHHREAAQRIGVQQVLLVMLGVRLGKGVGQPVVVRHQICQQGLTLGQQRLHIGRLFDQGRQALQEAAQARQIGRRGRRIGGWPRGQGQRTHAWH